MEAAEKLKADIAMCEELLLLTDDEKECATYKAHVEQLKWNLGIVRSRAHKGTHWGICFNCKSGNHDLCAKELIRPDGAWKCGCTCHVSNGAKVVCIADYKAAHKSEVKGGN